MKSPMSRLTSKALPKMTAVAESIKGAPPPPTVTVPKPKANGSAKATATKAPPPSKNISWEGGQDYIVLFLESGLISYETITLSKKPKGKPKDVAYALASILGIDQASVLGALHVHPDIDVNISKCGMEMRFVPKV